MSIHTPRRHAAGFSLIELMAAVAIVAILATLALSSYSAYVKRANRTYATNALVNFSQALQRCYSQYFTFQSPCPVATATTPTTTPDGYYSITVSIPANNNNSYTLTAVPVKSPQTNDTQCTTFTLLSSGQQQATNSQGQDSSQTCWGSG
jgi:type IV pilus assembly protein PilE